MTHPKCRGKYTIDGYFTAVSYKRVAKKLLYQFKYRPYLSDLQTVITDLLYENIVQNEEFAHALATHPLLIPIPLSKSKLRKRGYNQSELLAKNLGKRFDLETANLLVRTKETKPQYGLKREQRIENMRGAFGINSKVIASKAKQSGFTKEIVTSTSSPRNDGLKTAILVDDVVTTGSTLKEAAGVLKRNRFEKVWAVTFAQD